MTKRKDAWQLDRQHLTLNNFKIEDMRTIAGIILGCIATILVMCEPLDTLDAATWFTVLAVTKIGAGALYFVAWKLIKPTIGGLGDDTELA